MLVKKQNKNFPTFFKGHYITNPKQFTFKKRKLPQNYITYICIGLLHTKPPPQKKKTG